MPSWLAIRTSARHVDVGAVRAVRVSAMIASSVRESCNAPAVAVVRRSPGTRTSSGAVGRGRGFLIGCPLFPGSLGSMRAPRRSPSGHLARVIVDRDAVESWSFRIRGTGRDIAPTPVALSRGGPPHPGVLL